MIPEELYNGNINPSCKFIKSGSEYQKLNSQLAELIDELDQALNNSEKHLLEKISDTLCRMTYISQKECYIDGFRSGAQLMLEITSSESDSFE